MALPSLQAPFPEPHQSEGELRPGDTLLQGQYRIERFLASGGFGMTYLARDSLERKVVIKECFPAHLCHRVGNEIQAVSRAQDDEYRAIVRHFVNEARRLARLDHANIVGVHQVFEHNQTAYMALDFIRGRDLLDVVEDHRNLLGPDDVDRILRKCLDAVSYIHDQNMLHRDLAPDNILLDSAGNPVLIDFGAAREKASRASRAVSAMLIVKDGYSPQEFYVAGCAQDRSSDLYALGATFYHVITGEAPPDSQARVQALAENRPDPCVPLTKRRPAGYTPDFLEAIDKAMNVVAADRFQCADDWVLMIDKKKRVEAALLSALHDKGVEAMIAKLVEETNIAVEVAIRAEAERKAVEVAEPKPEPKKLLFPDFQVLPPEFADPPGTPPEAHSQKASATFEAPADGPPLQSPMGRPGLLALACALSILLAPAALAQILM